ncbi:MAG: MFS transporter, partial [Anaerovoracaceae bacterium]
IGTLLPLLGQYLSTLGFSGSEIGIVTGTGTMVSIFAGPFWGKVYANSKGKQKLLLGLCLCAALVALFLMQVGIFPLFVGIFALMYFFQSPIMALSDAMTVEHKQPFGFIRLWGAVGFAAGGLLAGEVAKYLQLKWIFIFYGLCYLTAAIILIFIHRGGLHQGNSPQEKAAAREEKEKKSYRHLFANKRYLQLLLCAFFFCGTNVANNTYFSFLYVEGGGTVAGVGLAFFLMAGSEAPFMAWTARLARRFTLEKLLLFAMILSTLRFAWYATGPDSTVLLLTFFLQGMVNGILLVEFIRYIARLVQPDYSGVAIALYYSLSSGGSTILCQLVGGRILDFTGSWGVYLFFALLNLMGTLLYLFFGLQKEEKE